MADNDDRSGLELLTKVKNDIALEIGEMDPSDPLRSERVKELHALTELSKSTNDERNKLIYENGRARTKGRRLEQMAVKTRLDAGWQGLKKILL